MNQLLLYILMNIDCNYNFNHKLNNFKLKNMLLNKKLLASAVYSMTNTIIKLK